jgi:DUF4097 and DUF4098 domain-containing protein YvlB
MKISSAVLATMLAASGAAAQQPINQTIPTAATGTVEIQNVSGEVHVIAWDRPEIRITGRLGEGTERLAVEGDRSRTTIRVVIPRNAHDVKGTELEVRLPARKDVTVHTVSADIGVTGVTGAVDGHATSGDVEISGSPSRVSAGSTSGDVTVRANTTQVHANSTSGDLRISGSVQQSVSAEAVSGDVVVDASVPDLVARSVSGDLQLTGASRRVTATTVSGDADVRAGRIQYGSFESVSGNFHFQGDLQRDAAFNVKSHSGDVELALPSRVAATFQIDTFSGDISNAFGPAAQRTSRYGPGRELHFSSGSGGPLITVKTFSGSVRLVRQ